MVLAPEQKIASHIFATSHRPTESSLTLYPIFLAPRFRELPLSGTIRRTSNYSSKRVISPRGQDGGGLQIFRREPVKDTRHCIIVGLHQPVPYSSFSGDTSRGKHQSARRINFSTTSNDSFGRVIARPTCEQNADGRKHSVSARDFCKNTHSMRVRCMLTSSKCNCKTHAQKRLPQLIHPLTLLQRHKCLAIGSNTPQVRFFIMSPV